MIRKWLILTTFIFTTQILCGRSADLFERTALAQNPDNPEVGISFFYDRLSPYGQWSQHPQHGWVWRPYNVAAGWQPYTDGQWLFTDDCGWTWDSNLDWGWAAFHYGRWGWEEPMGWFWVPGSEWGPAWVAWRMGPEYVGWAPLPPGVVWLPSTGLQFTGIDLDRDIPANRWVFVQDRFLVDPRLQDHLLRSFRNPTIFQNTRVVVGLRPMRGEAFDNGVPLSRIESAIGHRIPHLRIVSVGSVAAARGPRENAGQIRFFRPRIIAEAGALPPRENDLERRRQLERDQLQEQHRAEQGEMERQHQMERGQPGGNTEELQRRQENERQALRSEQENQQRALENRQRSQNQAPAPEAQPPARR